MPSADLAVVAAIISSFKNLSIDAGTAVFGLGAAGRFFQLPQARRLEPHARFRRCRSFVHSLGSRERNFHSLRLYSLEGVYYRLSPGVNVLPRARGMFM